jgi:hypothetical protein
MTPQDLWGWWFTRTGAPVRTVNLHKLAMASRVVREASLTTTDDADAYYDWLATWYGGVDITAMLRYTDRWAAYRSDESPSDAYIRKHGGRW